MEVDHDTNVEQVIVFSDVTEVPHFVTVLSQPQRFGVAAAAAAVLNSDLVGLESKLDFTWHKKVFN